MLRRRFKFTNASSKRDALDVVACQCRVAAAVALPVLPVPVPVETSPTSGLEERWLIRAIDIPQGGGLVLETLNPYRIITLVSRTNTKVLRKSPHMIISMVGLTRQWYL